MKGILLAFLFLASTLAPAAELRGVFADPHHGESFGRVTIADFEFGSPDISRLPASEKRHIDVAEAFMKSSSVTAEVIGHADQPTMSAAGNVAVSQARADNVKAELVARGVDAGRFVPTRGLSATECPTPGHQAACRKVEVFMFNFPAATSTSP